jgi:hypothetical protein
MGGQQHVVQRIDGRTDGYVEREESAKKAPRAPGWKQVRAGAANFAEATEIEESGGTQA